MKTCLKVGLLLVTGTIPTLFLSCGLDTEPEYDQRSTSTINLVGTDGTGLRPLAEGRVAFPTDSLVLFFSEYDHISTVGYDSTDFRPLYPSISWEWVSQSPHRDYFLLTTRKSSVDLSEGDELFMLSANMSSLTKLGLPKGPYGMASLSPNVQSIVFRYSSVLEFIGVDGNNQFRIAPEPDSAAAQGGIFASDSVIIYSQYRHFTLEVKSFNVLDRTHRLIATDMGSFSYSGRQVAGSKLILTHYDTTRIIDIYTSQVLSHFQAEGASFSSDGTQIVGCYGPNLLLLSAAGNYLKTLYSSPVARSKIRSPQFAFDDSHVLFELRVPIDY